MKEELGKIAFEMAILVCACYSAQKNIILKIFRQEAAIPLP